MFKHKGEVLYMKLFDSRDLQCNRFDSTNFEFSLLLNIFHSFDEYEPVIKQALVRIVIKDIVLYLFNSVAYKRCFSIENSIK